MISLNAKKSRLINRDAVLAALRENGPEGASGLAGLTGLSVATCAGIVSALVDEGLALELAERVSGGGRPARRYAYNPDRVLVAALAADAARGGTRLAWSVANACGGVLDRGAEKTALAAPEAMDALLDSLRARFPALRGAALSVPGVIRDGVVGICDLPELSGLAPGRRIAARHGLSSTLDNDVNYAALGHCRAFAAPGTENLAFLHFPKDNCSGAGLIVNGALLRGKSNFAGEISFIPLSGAGRDAQPAIHADPARAGKFIAGLIASVTAVVNPEIVVLSGDAAPESLLPGIRRRCLAMLPAEHLPDLEVCRDYDACRFAGMTAAALDLLRREGVV